MREHVKTTVRCDRDSLYRDAARIDREEAR